MGKTAKSLLVPSFAQDYGAPVGMKSESGGVGREGFRLVIWSLHQTQWTSSPRETAAAIRLAVRATSAQHSNRPL